MQISSCLGARVACSLLSAATIVCCLSVSALPARADDTTSGRPDPLARIHWTKGPAQVKLGDVGMLQLPAGYRFTDGDGSRTLQEITHNPPSGDEIGTVLPEDRSWFLIFSYDPSGYVKDDEKDSLNDETTDKMLDIIRQSTEEGNKIRASHGWSPVNIAGWSQRPFYDSQTRHLTWAIKTSSTEAGAESQSINYSSRLLGRGGVISALMVIDPPALDAALPAYHTVVGGVDFSSGNRYEEFRPGDKIAHYGLIGLVTGGAAVAVVKGWKFFAKIGAAALAGIAGLFKTIKSKFTRKSSTA
jgi:uncharacterized membrane-anchored protein